MIVESAEQAKALQDVGFLGQFVEPASPSEVAKQFHIAPNLAHHHAKRHAELGLLVEVKREGGQVYYQLAAKRIKHRRSLLPVGHSDERVTAALARLEELFLKAYERSDRIASEQDPDWAVYGFTPEPIPEATLEGDLLMTEARPPHLQVRTVRLSPEAYRRLVRQVWRLLEKVSADSEESEVTCTLAFVAMAGGFYRGMQDGQVTATFVPPAPPSSVVCQSQVTSPDPSED